jgi:hypothetical protein
MQALWFPVRPALGVPLQILVYIWGCWFMRPLACAVRADPAMLAAAGRICRGAQAVKQLALVAGGAASSALPPSGSGACDRAPMELLLPLLNALGCFLPVRVGFGGLQV